MQFQLKGKPDVIFFVFLSFFLSFFLFGYSLINGWLWNDFVWVHGSRKTHWWGKRVAESRRTRTLTVHPSIFLSVPYIVLVLVLCRVMMRLEPFMGHRQENPLHRWPVHHTHSFSHSLQSPVQLSCMPLDCGRNPQKKNINTE